MRSERLAGRSAGRYSLAEYQRLCNGIREEDGLTGDVEANAKANIETSGESLDPKTLRAMVAQFSSATMAGEYGWLLLEHQTDLSAGVSMSVSR